MPRQPNPYAKTYRFSLYSNNTKDAIVIKFLETLQKDVRGKFIRSVLLDFLENSRISGEDNNKNSLEVKSNEINSVASSYKQHNEDSNSSEIIKKIKNNPFKQIL